MAVDSYAFLPRAFVPMYDAIGEVPDPPVWALFDTPLADATVALLSSAGLYLPASQQPFDVERERQEPAWGDPTYRVIPAGVRQDEVDATHLHLNTADYLEDLDIVLPVHRLAELAAEGVVGAAAPEHYSLMGYQEAGAEVWRTETGPEIVQRCHAADIDALILAPA